MSEIRSKAFKIETLDFGLRLYTAMMVTIYGIAKPFQFSFDYKKDILVSELNGMELMWIFFGYSTVVPIIIGALQVGGSLLLVFKKTKLLGIIILVPILANIIMFDVVYKVYVGATIYASIFLMFLLISAYIEKKKLQQIAKIIFIIEQKDNYDKRLVKFVFGILILIVLFFLFQILI